MARSFLKEKQVPSMLWGEDIRHSVYILNRLPRAVSRVTPYDAWSGLKPDIVHVRVFGCIAHMKIPSVHMKKLDDRSKVVINLGKEPGTKAYRLYDPENKIVHVSRDVVFEEKKAWNWKKFEEIGDVPMRTFTVITGYAEEQEENTGGENSPMLHSQSSSGENYQSPSSEVYQSQTGENMSSSDSEGSTQPRKFKSLQEIYATTEAIELEDDELLLIGVDEPVHYNQAVIDHNLNLAMKQEMDALKEIIPENYLSCLQVTKSLV